MSMIIGICTEEHALLVADKRVTITGNDNPVYVNDRIHKIFNLNGKILFGAGGTFAMGEPLLRPFLDMDPHDISLEACREMIEIYYNDILLLSNQYNKRYYFLCGKDESGEMRLIRYDIDLYEGSMNKYSFSPKQDGHFSLCIAYPPRLSQKEDDLSMQFFASLLSSKSIEDMIMYSQDFISDIAKTNSMVSSDSEYLLI